MRAVDLIAKKRDGHSLIDEEIRWFIDAYTSGTLPDYQVSALLMAILLRGMSTDEVTTLTLAMANSGDTLDLSALNSYVVDKHSSGGVGDKTSLVVLPLVAACGVPVAKMSGRGLGYTGGTLDKMEAIGGFNVNVAEDDFLTQAQQVGLVLAGQTRDLAPADGKLYALRDVTATVSSLPLIASSIMSKKLAAGANGIVLDVKVGSGAFMQKLEDARALAQIMVDIGKNAERDMTALISDMNQPLGQAVGNALEVREAIETLHGNGPADFHQHCIEVAAHMLHLAGQGDLETTRQQIEDKISDRAGFEKFRAMVAAQGGDVAMVNDPEQLPQADITHEIPAAQTGYIRKVDAMGIAKAAFGLGAGREKKDDPIDPTVGVIVKVNVGDHVKRGRTVAVLHANDQAKAEAAQKIIAHSIEYSEETVPSLPLFYDVIR
jgi:pyrimidine-nucleoside phosphorylase